MAKGIDDKSGDTPVEQVPASGGEIRGLMGRYGSLQEEKKDIGHVQTNMLKEFDTNHGLPPFVFKFLRKIEEIEDDATRGRTWNTVVRSGKALGFDQQPDMLDEAAANDTEADSRPKRARTNA